MRGVGRSAADEPIDALVEATGTGCKWLFTGFGEDEPTQVQAAVGGAARSTVIGVTGALVALGVSEKPGDGHATCEEYWLVRATCSSVCEPFDRVVLLTPLPAMAALGRLQWPRAAHTASPPPLVLALVLVLVLLQPPPPPPPPSPQPSPPRRPSSHPPPVDPTPTEPAVSEPTVDATDDGRCDSRHFHFHTPRALPQRAVLTRRLGGSRARGGGDGHTTEAAIEVAIEAARLVRAPDEAHARMRTLVHVTRHVARYRKQAAPR